MKALTRARNWALTWGLVYVHAPMIGAWLRALSLDGHKVRPIVRWSRFWRTWVYQGVHISARTGQ